MHEYNVLLLNRIDREEAARLREQRALQRLATAGRRSWLLSLVTRLVPLPRPSRSAQAAPVARYTLPCPPAREPINL